MIIAKPNRGLVYFVGTDYFLTYSNVFESQFLEYRFSAYVLNKHMDVVSGSKARMY
jgi:hypothetical protein